MPWILSAFADEADSSVDKQIEALAEAKVRYVDLRNVDGFNIVELPVPHAEGVRKKLDAAGVKVCMFGSPIGKLDIADDFAIDERRMAHLNEMRSVFGATAVRMFSYFNKAKAPAEQWKKASLERVRRLTDLAEQYGLVLYHENEPGLYGGDLATVKTLRDEVHSRHPEHFKLIFDFDNYNQAGESVWANYLELRDTLGAIHLKESKKQPDGAFMHVPVGQGDGEIARILGDLASRGWEGPLTLEPHLARSPAVLATGPHGLANKSLSELTPHQCFCVAAQAAREMLHKIGRLG